MWHAFSTVQLIHRIRELIDRGRLDTRQVSLAAMARWVRARVWRDQAPPIGHLCDFLESMARLAVLKARHLAGGWDDVPQEDHPWEGPPPELAPRRAWLADRIAYGARSFGGGERSIDGLPAMLLPVPPQGLRNAMLAVLARHQQAPKEVSAPPTRASVERYSALIVSELALHGSVSLRRVAGAATHEQVAAFLACLTLTRQGRVALSQTELFADIVITAASAELEASA